MSGVPGNAARVVVALRALSLRPQARPKARRANTRSCSRDVLLRRFGGSPYSGDGIDVPFDAAGSTFNIDVALNGGGLCDGKIVLAHCRQTTSAQKQEQIASFAFQAEKIRAATGQPVAAFFMVSTDPQVGALKVETEELELGGFVCQATRRRSRGPSPLRPRA